MHACCEPGRKERSQLDLAATSSHVYAQPMYLAAPRLHRIAASPTAAATYPPPLTCQPRAHQCDYCIRACERAPVIRPHNNRLTSPLACPCICPALSCAPPSPAEPSLKQPPPLLDQAHRIAVLGRAQNPGFGDQLHSHLTARGTSQSAVVLPGKQFHFHINNVG